MHRLAQLQLQHQHDAGLARAYALGSCPMPTTASRIDAPIFWVNVTDDNIDVPGIVEFSNLRPLPCTVIYVPYYMPTTNPKWSWTDEMLAAEAFAAIRRINPEISESDRIAHYVGRLRNAQPICPPRFASHIPPMQTPVRGLQIADTCFYYPEDRGIAESVRLGKAMAMAIGSPA